MEDIQLFGPYQIISKQEAIDQGLKKYFTGKPCKNGHITLRRVFDCHCIKCDAIRSLKWNRDNPEKVKKWKRDNPEKVKASLKKSSAKFRADNLEKSNEQRRKSVYKWIKNNPELFALNHRHHSRINELVNRGLLQKKGAYKSKNLGCNSNKLIVHIESQFVDGMTWDQFDQIQIDHIRPISSFSDLVNNKEQRKVCFNYRNLQPLWAKDNRAKWDDYTPLDELAWVERMQALGYEGELFLMYEEGNSY